MKSIIACIVLVAFIAGSEALQCSTCGEENFGDCAADKVQTCSDSQTYCYRIKGASLVTRGCISVCTEINTSGQGTFCCKDKDLCNTATAAAAPALLSLLTVAAALLFTNRM